MHTNVPLNISQTYQSATASQPYQSATEYISDRPVCL